jgi:hypothetical protein
MVKINNKLLKSLKSAKSVIKPDPTKIQGARTEDDFAFGIFKFRGSNLLKYTQYCFNNNLDMNEKQNQITFLFKILKEEDALRATELKEAETVEQAAQIIHEYILKDTSSLQNTIDTAYDLIDRNSV